MEEFLNGMGNSARERPAPTLKGSIVAAAGVLVTLGLVVIAAGNDDGGGGTNIAGILLSIVAVVGGHLLLQRLPAGVAPAGVALLALGTFSTIGFAFNDADAVTVPGIILFCLYAGQWVVGPAKGANTLLTLALISLWAVIVDAAAGDPSETVFTDTFEVVPQNSFVGGDDTVAYLSLLIGVGLLFAARALDIRGYLGVSTSAIIVGNLSFVIGVFGVVGTFETDGPGGFLITISGATLAWIGSTGGRRFTTWLGGIGVLVGLLVILSTVVEFDDATQFGVASVFVGVGIILAAAFLNLSNDGDLIPATEGAAATVEAEPVAATIEAEPEPEPEPKVDPAWYPDPTGRHELRWHDGANWTVNVSDHGVVATDDGV